MSITIPPTHPIVYQRGPYVITLTPVAFRASKRHPWRSYETGNRKYKWDFQARTYMTAEETRDIVLYTYACNLTGVEYETHCRQCGAYTVVMFPPGWVPKPVDVTCTDCIVKNTSADLPQDGMRYYTPEYQNAMLAAMRGRS